MFETFFNSDKNFQVKDEGDVVVWGGITRPFMMQQKDDSFFSVIEYESLPKSAKIDFPELFELSDGWGFWIERQNDGENGRDFLVFFWKPIPDSSGSYVSTAVGKGIQHERNVEIDYFCSQTEKLYKAISKVTTAKLLEYQDMMDFLSFSVSMGEDKAELPRTPLYMDELLTQNNSFIYDDKNIFINEKRVVILSLPSLPDPWKFFDIFSDLPFRYVKRFLLLSDEERKERWKDYTKGWCSNRKYMLKKIEGDIFKKLNGYFYNGFVFHVDIEYCDSFIGYLEENLDQLEEFYRVEDVNLKNVWWGTLAGIHSANIKAPFYSFDSLTDYLLLCK